MNCLRSMLYGTRANSRAILWRSPVRSEYGVMQLIAETYDLMKRGWGLNDDELLEVYALWNKGELKGYFVEITSPIGIRCHAIDRRDLRPDETWLGLERR